MKSYARGLVAMMGLFFSVNLLAASLELERLFTTADQRVTIDRERLAFKHRVLSGRVNGELVKSAEPRQADRRLFFEALLRTEAGYSVWLNGSMVEGEKEYHGVLLNTKAITEGKLILKTPNGIRKLGLGQVYWVDKDRITESYEQP